MATEFIPAQYEDSMIQQPQYALILTRYVQGKEDVETWYRETQTGGMPVLTHCLSGHKLRQGTNMISVDSQRSYDDGNARLGCSRFPK